VLLIVGGVVVAAVLLLVGGLVGRRVLTQPEQISKRAYAREYCEAIEASQNELEDAQEKAAENIEDVYDFDAEEANASDREASQLSEAMVTLLDREEVFAGEVAGFSTGNRLRGSDGEALHEDIREWESDFRESIEELREDIDDVDMSDSDDAASDLVEAYNDREYVLVDQSDEGDELATAILEEDDECVFPYGYDGGE
jgi:hypothetical protein